MTTTSYIYGLSGELLGEYQVCDAGGPFYVLCQPKERLYLAGRVAWEAGEAKTVDRLGTQWLTGYRYGDESYRSGTDSFATYTRDNWTRLDHAWNRYYSSTLGRFTSADPYLMSGGLGNPQGWNRYSYVENDPVNYHDPSGLQRSRPYMWLDCWEGGCVWRIGMERLPDPGDGGGGPDPKREMRIAGALTTMVMRGFLDRTIDSLSDPCMSALNALAGGFGKSISSAGLMSFGKNLYFYDATELEGGLQLMDLGLPSYVSGANQTVASFAASLPSANAIALAHTSNRGPQFTNSVILTSGFWSWDNDSGLTLVHEAIHNFLQADDTEIAQKIQNAGYTVDPKLTPSQNFHKWLDDKCGARK